MSPFSDVPHHIAPALPKAFLPCKHTHTFADQFVFYDHSGAVELTNQHNIRHALAEGRGSGIYHHSSLHARIAV